MTRNEVFVLIDGERDYQNMLSHHSAERDAATSLAAWLVYIEQHVARVKERIYYLDDTAVLDEIRKIAALAVACMEHNDTPARKMGAHIHTAKENT